MKRLSALLVTLCIALASFAQGSVTVTQSSAISDLVNNKQTKPQTPAQPKPQTPAQPKPQTPAQPKPQTPAQPKPQTPAQPKPQTPAQPKPQTPATAPAQPQAQQQPAAAPTGQIPAEGTETSATADQTAPRPVVHQYSGQQPRRVPTGSEEEIAAMVKNRGGDYSVGDGISGKKVMRGAHKIKGWRIQVYNGGNKRVDREKAEELGQKVKKHYPGMPVYVHFYSPRWMTMCGNFVTHKEAEPYKTKLLNLGFKNVSIVRQQIVVE